MRPEMREKRLDVLLDYLVELCLLGPVSSVVALRRDDGGHPVRRRARLESEHARDWITSMSRAQ